MNPIGGLKIDNLYIDIFLTLVEISIFLTFRRQCFFDTERQLRFFKIYTQRNCELECLANFTVKTCGCAKFSMPSGYFDLF